MSLQDTGYGCTVQRYLNPGDTVSAKMTVEVTYVGDAKIAVVFDDAFRDLVVEAVRSAIAEATRTEIEEWEFPRGHALDISPLPRRS